MVSDVLPFLRRLRNQKRKPVEFSTDEKLFLRREEDCFHLINQNSRLWSLIVKSNLVDEARKMGIEGFPMIR